jgi:hypothetical protein
LTPKQKLFKAFLKGALWNSQRNLNWKLKAK